MKSLIPTALLAFALAASSFAAQWRIATVDLEKVFAAHPKTAAAEAELKVQEKALEEGVKVLDNGVIMKQLEIGYGEKCPTPGGIHAFI